MPGDSRKLEQRRASKICGKSIAAQLAAKVGGQASRPRVGLSVYTVCECRKRAAKAPVGRYGNQPYNAELKPNRAR